ncbi:MAG: ATP-binding protein, partial [Lachnospiraceae bacterium]|nr:ATP-binding protein [Lachnospiraceae bacterium]
MKEMTIEARNDNLNEVLAAVEELLEEGGCSMKDQIAIDVAVEEIFVNIANYAYAPGTGDATLQMEIADEPRRFVMTFIDGGMPYDPLAKEDPDVSLPLEER